MLKNSKYLYGSTDLQLPARLNFGDFLLQLMYKNKEKVAMINAATHESITYGQIVQESMNFAVSLTHLGLRKGQTVSICSENIVQFWGVVVGVACAGAVLNTVNPGYTEEELKHVISITKPTFVVLSPSSYKNHGKFFENLPHVEKIILLGEEKVNDDNVILYNDMAVANNCINSGDVIVNNRLVRNVNFEEFEAVDVVGQVDTLFVLFSSGTTGMPKGVMLTHLNIIAQCCLPEASRPDQLYLMITPWFHVMGLVSTLIGFAVGKTTIFISKFDINLFLKTIEEYKIKQIQLVPPILVAASKVGSQYDLSSVEFIYSGAAPLHKETIELAKLTFSKLSFIFQGYGMTEAGLVVTRFNHNDIISGTFALKHGSVGKAVACLTTKVVDTETREPLGPHQPGEICVKGNLIMKGYIGKDRSEDFDDEGFFKTGDVGYYDEDGCFFIVDRLKELIKYKGYQVAPAEIEALLFQHEGIADAGVVAVPDQAAGELPLAFVVKQPEKNVTEKEIQAYVAKKLSNPKHLRGGVRFVDAIPKNASGKILRKILRQMVKPNISKL